MPNPWDIGTTRILTGIGFKALATTSGGLAYALGRRDGEGAVSREEALEHSARDRGRHALPVNGDLENGFGHDPESVAETIRGAAAAGLVGCSIEDSTSAPGEPIYPLSQAVERIAAAVEAARSLPLDFMLTARAENYLHGRADLDDTIARLQAFEKAGADVLYAPGLRDIEDIRTVCAARLEAGQRPRRCPARRASRSSRPPAPAASASARASSAPRSGAFLRAAREVHDAGHVRLPRRAGRRPRDLAVHAGR